jgi:hypothetical protein
MLKGTLSRIRATHFWNNDRKNDRKGVLKAPMQAFTNMSNLPARQPSPQTSPRGRGGAGIEGLVCIICIICKERKHYKNVKILTSVCLGRNLPLRKKCSKTPPSFLEDHRFVPIDGDESGMWSTIPLQQKVRHVVTNGAIRRKHIHISYKARWQQSTDGTITAPSASPTPRWRTLAR